MRLPEFTAESALGRSSESYAAAPAVTSATGSIQPQGYVHTPGGGLIYCFNEGGYSGCFTIRTGHPQTLY